MFPLVYKGRYSEYLYRVDKTHTKGGWYEISSKAYIEGESPSQAIWRCLLVSRKVADREVRTEGSETTKSGTDEQERHTEAS